MADVVIVGFAVALLLALLDELIDVITIFIPPKAVNAVIAIGLSYLGLWLLQPESIKSMVVKAMASAFIARTGLTIAERAATYRATIIKQS